MALSKLKLLKDASDEVLGLQGNIREFVNQLNPVILSGSLVESIGDRPIVIGTGTTLVPHLLGRRFQGWHLVDIQGDARVWRDTTSTADPAKFLPLRASSSVTIKLWVF